MERKLPRFRIVAVLAAAAAITLLPAAAQNASEQQPNMAAALQHLRNADQQLQQASQDKGGHRVKAQQLVQQAITQVEQGVQYADTAGARGSVNPTPPSPADTKLIEDATRIANENRQHEPRMSGALEELAAAEKALQQSGSNKGGHREQAMDLVRQAITETTLGMEYYAQHAGAQGASGASQPGSTAGSAGAVHITNGPVIERADQNSATIAWSTDRQGSSVVDYGTDPNNLNQKAESPWGATGLTHRVQLKNLQPGTRYYFEVETGQAKGTSGGEVESNRYSFQTPNQGQPPIQNQQPQAARF